MSHRYYVLVGLEVPGQFNTGASPAEEKASAARLVEALLSDAIAERDIHAAVRGAIGLSSDNVEHIVLALRDDTQKQAASWKDQQAVLDRKLAEISAYVDRIVEQRKETL